MWQGPLVADNLHLVFQRRWSSTENDLLGKATFHTLVLRIVDALGQESQRSSFAKLDRQVTYQTRPIKENEKLQKASFLDFETSHSLPHLPNYISCISKLSPSYLGAINTACCSPAFRQRTALLLQPRSPF